MTRLAVLASVLVLGVASVSAQDVIAGADVSFLRQMESRGVVFKDAGLAKPGLQILKDHGYTWVRLRVMVDPITLPNTLDYTIASAKDAKSRGFKVLLESAPSRNLWVVMCGAYRVGPERARSATSMLLDAFGPERLMWGSDWPHTDTGLNRATT